MDVKTAIETADSEALRRLLGEDLSRADQLIRWGDPNICLTHPLHYISDLIFQRKLSKDSVILLVDVLIEAGADVDFQTVRDDGKKSDTPLIGAASLGAEEVGVRLIEAGARRELRGLFGETALHWAAMLGEDRLTAKLIEGVHPDLLTLKDEKYNSPPLGWAIHGWSNAPAGNHGRQREVIMLLVGAGATVEPEWLSAQAVRSNRALLDALQSASR